jgi:hypothetical protein
MFAKQVVSVEEVSHAPKNSSSVMEKSSSNFIVPLPSIMPIFLRSFFEVDLGTSRATISLFFPYQMPISSPARTLFSISEKLALNSPTLKVVIAFKFKTKLRIPDKLIGRIKYIRMTIITLHSSLPLTCL